MDHFHIRWADSKLDWEAFQTREEAAVRARELARPGEAYVIVGADCVCPRYHSIAGLRSNVTVASELS